jgi:GT2 family glycosyltransferase
MQFSKERAPQGSALQALKRDVFSKVGLQDPNIPYVEDLDFFLRMELAGVELAAASDEGCIHSAR